MMNYNVEPEHSIEGGRFAILAGRVWFVRYRSPHLHKAQPRQVPEDARLKSKARQVPSNARFDVAWERAYRFQLTGRLPIMSASGQAPEHDTRMILRPTLQRNTIEICGIDPPEERFEDRSKERRLIAGLHQLLGDVGCE